VRSDGSVACWGYACFDEPEIMVPAGDDFVQVSAGEDHDCAQRGDGTVTCWAADGFTLNAPAPAGTFRQISAGREHSCGVATDGHLVCWGVDDARIRPPLGAFSEVSVWTTSCARALDGSVACWGSDPEPSSFEASLPPIRAYRDIAAGRAHMCRLGMDGEVDCSWSRMVRPGVNAACRAILAAQRRSRPDPWNS
jgi:hypothetical protein